MTKVRKQRRKKRFRANVNRKRLRNKLRKLPEIECEDLKESWELKKSIKSNLKDMGLAYNPNDVLRIAPTKQELLGVPQIARINGGTNDSEDDDERLNQPPKKLHVVAKLESDARAPRQRMFKLPNNQVQFATYLMDKYGDDYKAMTRDRKNHYQMTWRQIRSLINTFKGVPEQYAEYLLKKGEIVLDDPTPLEETRRKIGKENLEKHNVPRKRKVRKPLWEVESIDDEEDDEEKFLEDESEQPDDSSMSRKNTENSGLKKLKLFSDDESENETESKPKKTKVPEPRQKELKGNKIVKENPKQTSKKSIALEKSQSSDSDDDSVLDDDDDDDDDDGGFVNLSDMSEEGLSDDDVLDDGEFVTDSDDEST